MTHTPPPVRPCTSLNDAVDAVLRRSLVPVPDATVEGEDAGTHDVTDSDLLRHITARARELTAGETSDLLLALERSERFSRLPPDAPARFLDACVRDDGPFAPLIRRLSGDDDDDVDDDQSDDEREEEAEETSPRLPPAVSRLRRRVFPRTASQVLGSLAKSSLSRAFLDLLRPPSSPMDRGAVEHSERPPEARGGGWHMPYDFSPRDVARLLHALASFPPAEAEAEDEDENEKVRTPSNLLNRARAAEAAAALVAEFSRDGWTRANVRAEDLALIAWALAELPAARSLGFREDADDEEEAGAEAEASASSNANASAASRARLRSATRRALRELSHPVRRHAAEFDPDELVAVACAYERAYEECWLDGGDVPRRTEKEDEKTKGKNLFDAKRRRVSALADGRATANHILQALAPRALQRPERYSAAQLGYVADACARFGVHPKREGIWNWASVVRRRRRAEMEAEAENEAEEKEAKEEA